MSTSPDRVVLVLDVCGTIYDANTTAGFCAHHHARVGNRLRNAFLTAICARRGPLRLALALIDRVTGYDLHRWLVIRSLRGEHRGEIEISAISYVDSLDDRRIPQVADVIADLRQEGPEMILVSNGIDPVISEIANRMGAAWVSSLLAWNGTICTGRLAADTVGEKAYFLEKSLGTSLHNTTLTVVTDNQSDADIITAASRAFIVQKGRRKKWMESYDAQFIRHG